MPEITQDEFSKIIVDLKSNEPTLTLVKLFNKDISNEHIKTLSESLESNTNVVWLNLSNNPRINDESASYILNMLDKNSIIDEIKLDNTSISEEKKKEIIQKINYRFYLSLLPRIKANDETLSEVNLYNRDITNEQLKTVCDLLETNTVTKRLYISWNKRLTDECVDSLLNIIDKKVIENIICHMTGLSDEKKDLIYDKIRDNFISPFIPRLLSNDDSLVEIDFSSNDLSDSQITTIFEALSSNTILQKINLSHNIRMSDQSVSALLKALEQNKTLKEISLNGTSVSDEKKEEIQKKINQ